MPFNTMINQQSVDALTAPKLKESFFADQIYMPTKGVDEGFSPDANAASIRVVRQKLPDIETRQLGASVNGGAFNDEDSKGVQSAEYFVDVTNVYDGNLDIAETQEDMFSLPVVEATIGNFGKEAASRVNSSTIAEQVKAWANDASGATPVAQSVTIAANANETAYRDAVLDASAVLDDGDIDNGVETYPGDMRQIVCRPTFATSLFKGKNIIVGGDLSVALLERGVIAEGTYNGNGNAYVGEVNNTPIFKAPKALWDRAAKELVYATNGVTDTAKANNLFNTAAARAEINKIEALMVSAVGTLRGIATGNRVKSIPSPKGAGIRLQPKFRWGVECIYPSSVVPIVKSDFDLDALVPEGKKLVRLPAGSQA